MLVKTWKILLLLIGNCGRVGCDDIFGRHSEVVSGMKVFAGNEDSVTRFERDIGRFHGGR